MLTASNIRCPFPDQTTVRIQGSFSDMTPLSLAPSQHPCGQRQACFQGKRGSGRASASPTVAQQNGGKAGTPAHHTPEPVLVAFPTWLSSHQRRLPKLRLFRQMSIYTAYIKVSSTAQVSTSVKDTYGESPQGEGGSVRTEATEVLR